MIHIDVLAHKFLIRIKYWVIIIILIGFEMTIKKKMIQIDINTVWSILEGINPFQIRYEHSQMLKCAIKMSDNNCKL